MSQKGLAPILIILIIAAAFGGYFIFKTYLCPSGSGRFEWGGECHGTGVKTSSKTDEITDWKTYTKENYFTFKYPVNWRITQTTDAFNFQVEDYKKLGFKDIVLEGSAGKLRIWWADNYGGGCMPNYEQIIIDNKTVTVCHQLDGNGGEIWTQIVERFDKPEGLGINIEAFANAPYQKNRDILLKILSSFKLQ